MDLASTGGDIDALLVQLTIPPWPVPDSTGVLATAQIAYDAVNGTLELHQLRLELDENLKFNSPSFAVSYSDFLFEYVTKDPPPIAVVAPNGAFTWYAPIRTMGVVHRQIGPLYFLHPDACGFQLVFGDIQDDRVDTKEISGTFSVDPMTGDVLITDLSASWTQLYVMCGLDVRFWPLTLELKVKLEGGDPDGDGVFPGEDNCPEVPNPGQEDADADGMGNVCDPCPTDALNDVDGDGFCAGVDNCPPWENPGQEDLDGDGIGDLCDSDPDGDGIDTATYVFDPIEGPSLVVDNCHMVANAGQVDSDGEGVGDACDNCPWEPNLLQEDADADGDGNVCDPCLTPSAKLAPGDILVVDRKADAAGDGPGTIFVVDPLGTVSAYTDSPLLADPRDIAIDPSGDLLISDADADPLGGTAQAGAILRIDPANCSVTTAGMGAAWSEPVGIDVDARGVIRVAERGTGTTYQIPQGEVLAKSEVKSARLVEPLDVSSRPGPSLYLTSYDPAGSGGVLEYDPATALTSELAPGSFDNPVSLTPDGTGNLYVLESGAAKRITRLDLSSGIPSTIISDSSWNDPQALALDALDLLVMTDPGNSRGGVAGIYSIHPAGLSGPIATGAPLEAPAGVAIVGLPYVATESDADRDPDLAFSSLSDRYLGIWESDGRIYGRYVWPDGRVSRNRIEISETVQGMRPSVAHQITALPDGTEVGAFLVVWESPTTLGSIVMGRLVDEVGALTPPPGAVPLVFSSEGLAPGDTDNVMAAVASRPVVLGPRDDPSQPSFLVSWAKIDSDTALPDGIYAAILARDGAQLSPEFALETGAANRVDPALAYSRSDDSFLCVFDRAGVVSGLQVTPDGGVSPGPGVIASLPSTAGSTHPSVAFSSAADTYQVVWTDDRFDPGEIFGQEVDANGLLVGGNLIIDENTVGIANMGSPSDHATVASLEGARGWLVAYQETRDTLTITNPTSIRARRVGGTAGSEFALMSKGDSFRPHLARENKRGNFMLLFEHEPSGSLGFDTDIWGRSLDDTDADAWLDLEDPCPRIHEIVQQDSDGDGFGDACDPYPLDPNNDIDGDGVGGDSDSCPLQPNGPILGTCLGESVTRFCLSDADCAVGTGFETCSLAQENTDSDVPGDVCDNCPFIPNSAQTDSNGNGFGDGCECGDLDGDGHVDVADVAVVRAFLSDPVGAPLTPEAETKCSVYGGGVDCDLVDVVVTRRFLALPSLAPGLARVCQAATSP